MLVLDASAVLAVLFREAGADVVLAHSNGAMLSSVNYCETVSRAVDRGVPATLVQSSIARMRLGIVPFDLAHAEAAAALRAPTRHAGLSLGDRACLALAKLSGARALTADRAWAGLDLGVDIRLIR
jgi:PIN domain nuclease of toxin-antitoxin system